MRPQTEASFQRQVTDLARLLGWRVAWFRPVRVQRRNGQTYHETPVGGDGRGWPDLILVRGSRLIAAELKMPGRRPTPEQIAWLDRLSAAGAEVFVWRPSDWNRVEATLR